jgi:hypothetical protein
MGLIPRSQIQVAALPSLILTVVMACLAPETRADAIVRNQAMQATNIAEMYVDASGVRVELEIGLNDLESFSNLLPDPLYERFFSESKPLKDRLKLFFEEDLVIRSDDGELIPGYVLEMAPRERVRRDDVTGEPLVSDTETAETVIYAELSYPFETKPTSLTFINGRSRSIGFVVYHKGVAVNDFRYLTPVQTLNLDWNDPWYSSFERRALRRTYFAPMSAFIYVEPYEVRKEIIVRPKDLQQWVDLGLEGRETIPVEMQPELKRQVAEFLRTRQETTIDDKPVDGELARINFLERTLKTSNVIDPPRELDINVATLGVIFVYPTVEPLPQSVKLQWDLFNEKITVVPGASVDQAGALPSLLEPDFPVLEWQNFLQFPELPTLKPLEPPPGSVADAMVWGRWLLILLTLVVIWWSAGSWRRASSPRVLLVLLPLTTLVLTGGGFWLAGQATLSEQRASELVGGLLHNIYRAFDFRAEGDIYDVLEQSVAGNLLTDVYLETRRGLVLENQGGARAKVKEIQLTDLSTEPSEEGGIIATATWVVGGSVGHWGHLHQRRNSYQAELDIRPIEGAWKLIGMEVLEEERL